MFETRQVGKLVQHHQNILNPLTDHSKVRVFFNALLQTKVSNLLQERQLRSGNVRFFLFNFLDLMLSSLSHSQSLQHSKTYLQSLETKP